MIGGGKRCASNFSMRISCKSGGRLAIEKVRYTKVRPSCSSTKCSWSTSSSTVSSFENRLRVFYKCRGPTYGLGSTITPSAVAKSSCKSRSSSGRVLTAVTTLLTWNFSKKAWESWGLCSAFATIYFDNQGVRYCAKRDQCFSSCPPKFSSFSNYVISVPSSLIGYSSRRSAGDASLSSDIEIDGKEGSALSVVNETFIEQLFASEQELLGDTEEEKTNASSGAATVFVMTWIGLIAVVAIFFATTA